MPSVALTTWRTSGRRALDEIEAAHAAVGGTGPERRRATQQINQAYAVLLSSQFQRFCRDLHTEAADFVAARIAPAAARGVVLTRLIDGRRLSGGNPNPGNIGADFNRFGLPFWTAVLARDARNTLRQSHLTELNAWRNAVAHQDFDPARLGGRVSFQLRDVRVWRRACDGLAGSFDAVVAVQVSAIIGVAPW